MINIIQTSYCNLYLYSYMTIYDIILLQTLILLIWFDTDAFIEYCKLSKYLKKWFKIDGFYKKFEDNFELTYHTYLRQYHNCFFIKLITCPICLNTWLSIIFCGIWFYNDFIHSFILIMFFSLLFYFIFKKLMR